MILLTINSKYYWTNERTGWEWNNKFYEPHIKSYTDIAFKADPILKLSSGQVTIMPSKAYLLEYENDVSISLTDKSKTVTVFTGKMVLIEKGTNGYVYQFREVLDTLKVDLLQQAPDLKDLDTDTDTFNDERSYPMVLGAVKYVVPLALSVGCFTGCGGEYHADGTTEDLYDGGVGVNYTQTGSTINKTNGSPIYEVTADINGNTTVSTSKSTRAINTTSPFTIKINDAGFGYKSKFGEVVYGSGNTLLEFSTNPELNNRYTRMIMPRFMAYDTISTETTNDIRYNRLGNNDGNIVIVTERQYTGAGFFNGYPASDRAGMLFLGRMPNIHKVAIGYREPSTGMHKLLHTKTIVADGIYEVGTSGLVIATVGDDVYIDKLLTLKNISAPEQENIGIGIDRDTWIRIYLIGDTVSPPAGTGQTNDFLIFTVNNG
jgi:hypothetical protein